MVVRIHTIEVESVTQVVTFSGNPGPVFEALADAKLPDLPPPPAWEIELVPDSFTVKDFAGSASGS